MSLAERMLRLARPRQVADWAPPPREVAPGLFRFERRLRFPPGIVLPTAMTAVRQDDGALVLLAPLALDAPTRRQLAALGPVATVVAPNSFHYLFAAEYAAAFPAGRTYLAPGLPARVPTCPPGIELGDAVRPAWDATLDHLVFGPVDGLAEVVFLHRPTATLVLTDLAMNLTAFTRPLDRWLWRASGIPPRFGPSRTARLTFLRDRRLAAERLAAILRWEFDRIVVTHGEPIERDGRRAFTDAFRAFLD